MKMRYRLIRRNSRKGTFYLVDTFTNHRESLGTSDLDEANRLLHAKNEAQRQPIINTEIAKAYLSASDPDTANRTWQNALTEIISTKTDETRARWERAARDKAFDLIRSMAIIETQPKHLFGVLNAGTVSTNVHLRKLHNFCLDMNYLLRPIIPRKRWKPIEFKEKRAIKLPEHLAIIERERNPELKSYYEVLWHLGGSQTDVALLQAEAINWQDKTLAYVRGKTGTPALLHFSGDLEELLKKLPSAGPLFPNISKWHERHRAVEFKRRCQGLGIQGISLHSYRYAWAERAMRAGYPQRFAQAALGHNSKAVHQAYAKKAEMRLPSLEEFEKRIVPLKQQAA